MRRRHSDETESTPDAEAEAPVANIQGTIVGLTDNTLSVRCDGDALYRIAPNAVINLNGKPAKLSDFHAGDKVTLVGLNPAHDVLVSR